MVAACALSIADLDSVQPLLVEMGQSFRLSVNQMGVVATLIHLGIAAGLLLMVPLGDRLNRRTFIVGQLGIVTLALLLVALAPTMTLLMVAEAISNCVSMGC
jgi:predicted MFS family arabinose efflux permease